jgi:hypothetical protein
MQTIAAGWNEGNARKAADCFSEDAIYVEPPEKQLYHRIVTVKLESGLIKHWREYQYRTELNWQEFTSHNPF